MKGILPSLSLFFWVAVLESSDGPAVSVPSWNKPALSTQSAALYLMRKTSADIPAFLGVRCSFNNNPRDGNMIALSKFLSLFDSVFFPFFVFFFSFFPLRLSFSRRPTTSTVFSISDSMAAYALASQAKPIWHRDCTVFTWHALLQWSHPPTLVTLESTSPLLPKRRPVSIQSPRPSSSCGSPEAAHWPWVQLSHEAGVRRGKEEVTGDF